MTSLVDLKIEGLQRGVWYGPTPAGFFTAAVAYQMARRNPKQRQCKVTWWGNDKMQLPAGLTWFTWEPVEGEPEEYPICIKVEVADGVYEWRPYTIAADDVVVVHDE